MSRGPLLALLALMVGGALLLRGRQAAAATPVRPPDAEPAGGVQILQRAAQALGLLGTAYRLGTQATKSFPSTPGSGPLQDLYGRLFGPSDAQAAAAAEAAVGASSATEAAAFGTDVPEILTGATEFGTGGGIEAAAGLEGGAGAGTAIVSGALSLGVGLALGAAGAPPPVSAVGGALAGTAAYASAAAIPVYSLYLGAFAGVIGGAISMALDMAESEGATYLPHRQKALQGMTSFVVDTFERIALGAGTPAAIRATLADMQPTVRQFRFDLSIPDDLRQAAFSGGYESGEQAWPQVNADLQTLIGALLALVPAAAAGDAEAQQALAQIRENWMLERKRRLRRMAEEFWFREGANPDWGGVRRTLEGSWLGENGPWFGPGIYSFLPSGYTPQEIEAIIGELRVRAAQVHAGDAARVWLFDTGWINQEHPAIQEAIARGDYVSAAAIAAELSRLQSEPGGGA